MATHRDLPKDEFPHTWLSRAYRHRVAEIRDMAAVKRAVFTGKASWYSRSTDSSGANSTNESMKAMYAAYPYMAGRKETKPTVSAEDGRKKAEELMYRFMERDRATKAAREAAGDART